MMSNEDKSGMLYCLFNEMFLHHGENIYKLGMCFDMNKRLSGYTTSYLDPPIIKAISKRLRNKTLAENYLFALLNEYRLKRRREFFKCDLKIIEDAMSKVEEEFDNKNDNEIETIINNMEINVQYVKQVKQKQEENVLDNLKYLLAIIENNNEKLIRKKHIVNDIINTLGFDLNDIDRILKKEQFYINSDTLLNDSDFSKNYESIRKLFDKANKVLDKTVKGNCLSKIINSYLCCFGLELKCTQVQKKINKKNTKISSFNIKIMDKYKDLIKIDLYTIKININNNTQSTI